MALTFGPYSPAMGMQRPDDDIRRPRDIGYIDLPCEAERRYWTREFGCSPQQLADAVATVGPLVVDVRSHLGACLTAEPVVRQSSCLAESETP
jgi:uncharacterized protein DUF3606